jgi:hypothetical protein
MRGAEAARPRNGPPAAGLPTIVEKTTDRRHPAIDGYTICIEPPGPMLSAEGQPDMSEDLLVATRLFAVREVLGSEAADAHG